LKKILYIGNNLAIHGKPPTAIDLLSIKLRDEGYQVITASSKKNKILRILDMLFTTFQNRNKVDVTIIDTYSTLNFYYAVWVAMVCRFFKMPYITILHGGNLPSRLKRNPHLCNQLFNNAVSNIAPSEYLKTQFKKMGICNLKLIPNTLEIENYSFKNRETISPKLLWVRSFSEIYNPLLAIEIVKTLKKRGVEVSLTMVGPEKDDSLKQCKKISEENKLPVTFTGILKKEDWIKLSEDFDIFINTTNFDNMPVSVMEAMALGLPVISTNVGGMPYLIENEKDGILVIPNNAEVFADAIEALCENDLKTKKITLNARVKMESIDWQNVKHKWKAVLNT
jgi:glycosyltransferase involved in cell wall biosynthesis